MKKSESAGDSSASRRHILAIFNPAAGRNRRRRFDEIVNLVKKAGCAVTVRETAAPGHAETIAREAKGAGFDLVAAAGGDGTINEVVNGLAGTGLALGIVPLGTANVVADEIGLSKGAHEIARVLVSGPLRPIRVGRANGRRFVMMAGVGFDANVIGRVSPVLKKILGPLAYVWTAALQGFRDPFAHCAVTVDGEGYGSVSVVACNGRRYGGPFVAAPRANLADDSFQVVLMKGRGWFSVARYGLSLIFGKVGLWSDVEILPGRDVVVSGATGQAVQADGEIVAALPVRIEIDPEPVRLAFPL
ncbi:MAG: diacylglycerol kinase family lipid kinase [Rhodospirillaceae bacterium]|nr:diacylglycerol kinase family lipid kinase [Rhodospirillaceae bacterium]